MMVSRSYQRPPRTLGILGGSGLYDVPGLEVSGARTLSTPYGAPSAAITEGRLGDTRLLFLSRHGVGHKIPPHEVNYRANICALKMAGAQQLVSISAVGSLREEMKPGEVVIVNQYIDWTKRRASTYFDSGVVAHVSFADPVCANLSTACRDAAEAAGGTVHMGGTYLCMEGPQFSTRAESHMYRSWGASIIGMTAMPEAKLAREAQLPYATVAMVTDYDCWRESEEAVTVDQVISTLKANGNLAQELIKNLPERLPDPTQSAASYALRDAVITPADHTDPDARAKLTWLLG